MLVVLDNIVCKSAMVSFVNAAESLHAHNRLIRPGTCKDGVMATGPTSSENEQRNTKLRLPWILVERSLLLLVILDPCVLLLMLTIWASF